MPPDAVGRHEHLGEEMAVRFMSGDPEVPVWVRLARNLLLTQAGLLLLGAAYLLLARAFTGATGTVGGGAGLGFLALVYLALALVVAVIGINVGRLVGWARYAALLIEIVLVAYLVSQAVQRRGSSVVGFLLAVAIIGLLLSPRAGRAFVRVGAERAGGQASPAPPADPAPPAGGPPGARLPASAQTPGATEASRSEAPESDGDARAG